MSFLEVYPWFCTRGLGVQRGTSPWGAWLTNRTARSSSKIYQGREWQQTYLHSSCRTEAVGGSKVTSRVPHPPPELRECRTAMKSHRTFSIAFHIGDRGGGVETGEAWVLFINKHSTQWEVFLSNYRSCWKLQARQDLWPRRPCLCVVIKSYF